MKEKDIMLVITRDQYESVTKRRASSYGEGEYLTIWLTPQIPLDTNFRDHTFMDSRKEPPGEDDIVMNKFQITETRYNDKEGLIAPLGVSLETGEVFAVVITRTPFTSKGDFYIRYQEVSSLYLLRYMEDCEAKEHIRELIKDTTYYREFVNFIDSYNAMFQATGLFGDTMEDCNIPYQGLKNGEVWELTEPVVIKQNDTLLWASDYGVMNRGIYLNLLGIKHMPLGSVVLSKEGTIAVYEANPEVEMRRAITYNMDTTTQLVIPRDTNLSNLRSMSQFGLLLTPSEYHLGYATAMVKGDIYLTTTNDILHPNEDDVIMWAVNGSDCEHISYHMGEVNEVVKREELSEIMNPIQRIHYAKELKPHTNLMLLQKEGGAQESKTNAFVTKAIEYGVKKTLKAWNTKRQKG